MHETGKVVIAISVPGGRVARKTRLRKTLWQLKRALAAWQAENEATYAPTFPLA